MENPYQSINTDPSQQGGNSNGLEASSYAQSTLISSKGWVRFISVLGFIYFAIMVIGLFAMISVMGQMGGAGGLVVLLFLVMTVVVFMLALRLSKFSSSIGRMEISRNPADLENAMIEQMKFWRIAGILVLIGLVFTVLALLAPAAFR